MLVLSRKSGERIQIGEDISLVVLEVRGDRIKLGISAPDYVAIARSELMQVLAEETRKDTRLARPVR